MSTSEERGRIARQVALSHEDQVSLAKDLKDRGYGNAAIAHILRIPENSVRVILKPKADDDV